MLKGTICMNSVFEKNSGQPVYIQLYEHFRKMILTGAMPSDSKLPSIRKCAEAYSVSKTTVEAAYVQLEAEGCIYSVPQSGFYVAKMSDFTLNSSDSVDIETKFRSGKAEYDFTSSAVDEETFDFKLWQRYVKSALRTDARLLDYGDPQGEEDLRKALCSYVSHSRGIVCSENQIVIGAGVQNLLQLLCVLENSRKNIFFLGIPYEKGETIFHDYGKTVMHGDKIPDNTFKTEILYTSPSHINYTGDVISLSKRIDLLKYARDNDCIIVEDDYDSEFSYAGRPVPALRSLDGGERVIYIGTFSKLLLPSIRISFMVLTNELTEKYYEIRDRYNQTASKTEQIALCRYISDGHLYSRIKKTKKLYADKTKRFYNRICSAGNDDIKIKLSQSGFVVSISGAEEKVIKIKSVMEQENMQVGIAKGDKKNELLLLFSVSAIPSDHIAVLAQKVVECLKKYNKI